MGHCSVTGALCINLCQGLRFYSYDSSNQYDTKETKDVLQQKIDGILKEVAEKLILEEISQESFRTFIEAYKTTRDAIERH